MNHNFYSSDELEQILAEMKISQRKELLRCIEDILASMGTVNQAGDYWKAARMHVHFVEGRKFPSLAVVPCGGARLKLEQESYAPI